MNRCLSRSTNLILLLAATLLLCITSPVSSQVTDPQRIPPIATKAVRGVLRVTAPPEVLMDGKPARLAPGARIRHRNNLMVMSGALIGQDLVVRYTRDPLGLIHEVWILTATEAAASLPAPPTIQPH